MVTSTISWPELIWTVVTFLGFIFCSRIALRSILHLVSLRIRRINSIREYAAVTTVIAFTSWVAVEAIFVAIGIDSMTIHNNKYVKVSQYIVAALFILGNFLLTWAAFEVDKRRQKIENLIIEIEEGIVDEHHI